MYSDSDDDSQLSQPHLFIKKKSIDSTVKEEEKSEDVVDRARSSSDLINLNANYSNLIDLNNEDKNVESTSTKTTKKAKILKPQARTSKSPTDKLLIKYSSSSESEEPISFDAETSLSELLDEDDEDVTKLVHKYQQTSPTLFDNFNSSILPKLIDKPIDWNEIKKYNSITSLESTVHSPELAPFQSKYVKNWQQQQKQYYDQKQIELSPENRFSRGLNLNYDYDLKLKYNDEHQHESSINFGRKQYGIFNFVFNEELFYRLRKSFPQVTDKKIRTIMYDHSNEEHDVIAAIINSLSPKREKRRLKREKKEIDKELDSYIKDYRQSDQLDEERKRLMAKDEQEDEHNYAYVKIKIKYLKKLYPDVEVLELFYLLHNCDMKSNIVAKKLEEFGYKRRALSDSEESIASSDLQFEELMPELKLNFGEQEHRFSILQAEYSQIDVYLVEEALKCTKFNLNEARKLLDTFDVNEYKNKKVYEFNYPIDDSQFIFKTDRGTQTNLIDYFELGNSYSLERKPNGDETILDNKSTWTKEDEMQIGIIEKTAIGSNDCNRKGSAKREKSVYNKKNQIN